ncbi:hypothetical protein MCCARTNEY_19 [Bacillus phage vB_BanH_McCartney]|nr:hypothetical protein MCCARTNEY_19 [Bacillus phage vB_BanH_McCartney]
MKNEIHPFRKLCSNQDVVVGDVLTFANGDEGKVTSIRSVKFITMNTVEVVGRAKMTKRGVDDEIPTKRI